MKNVLKTLIAAIVLTACIGCSKDDPESSAMISYDLKIHGDEEIYIGPMEAVDASTSFTYTHKIKLPGYKSSVTVNLNPGNYYIMLKGGVIKRGFQILENRQTQISITDNYDAIVSY